MSEEKVKKPIIKIHADRLLYMAIQTMLDSGYKYKDVDAAYARVKEDVRQDCWEGIR